MGQSLLLCRDGHRAGLASERVVEAMNTATMRKAARRHPDQEAPVSAPRCAPAWRMPLIILSVGLVACWALPDQLGLLARICIIGLLVLSLDLVVGIAGLATLGQAAMFGAGAYAAGIFALRVAPDP